MSASTRLIRGISASSCRWPRSCGVSIGPGDDLAPHRGLADPGLALEEQHAESRSRRLQERVRLGEHGIAPEDRSHVQIVRDIKGKRKNALYAVKHSVDMPFTRRELGSHCH